MANVEISEGIRLDLPSTVEARERVAGGRRSPGARQDIVDGALIEAGYSVDAVIELTPAPAAPRRGTRDGRAAAAEVEPVLRVDVAADESAVALLETEGGVFAWLIPDEPTGEARRGRRTLEFPLAHSIASTTARSPVDRRGRRGIISWIGNQLIDPIRVRVLRYAANVAIDLILEKIEGDRTFGLVDMAGPAASWKPGAAMPALADGVPAHILLMVHGTFSTTAGSFGGLELTEAGKAFLDLSRKAYDAVIGFDHKTLGEDPEQNAAALLKELDKLPKGSTIDAVAFSRGGLVLRTLAERLAPADLTFDRMVFVGCTNAGTHLAEPENWNALVDLYTNIVMAGARAIAILSANPIPELVSEGLSAIGRFVKFLPQLAITDKKVPGLAAMEPDGSYVAGLNDAEPEHGGQSYHVIASDFEPRIEPSKGITGEVAEYLIDRIVDRLFQGIDNDLVVDTGSMWEFGKQGERLSGDGPLLIPSEACVYHTIYFASERVAELLGSLLQPPTASLRRSSPPPGPMPAEDFDVLGGGGGGGGGSGGDGVELSTTEFGGGLGGLTGVGPARADFGAGAGAGAGGGRRSYSRTMRGDEPDDAEPAMAEPLIVMNDPAAEEPAMAPPEPAPPAPDSVACHFAAEMQPTPLVGLPVPLFVTISPERIDVARGPTTSATDKAVEVEKQKQIEIEIIPSRNCRMFGVEQTAPQLLDKRQEGPSLRFVDVPTKGAVSLRFEVEGLAPGEAEIFIEARQESRLLASFLLKPVFTLQDDARISASQIARPTFAGEDDPAVLRIYEMHMADNVLRLRFDLSCEDPGMLVQQDVDLRPNFNLGAFVAMFLSKLEEAYDLPNYQDVLDEITAFSIARTRELMPERVRQELWNQRDRIKAIQVISEEPLIPWELLYIADPAGQSRDREGFLAEWGLFRWMYNASWPRRNLSLRGDRVFHVVPDYLDAQTKLKGAQKEREMLMSRFDGAQAIEPKSREVRKFLREKAPECDLLHFACHGLADQKAILSSDLIMQETESSGRLIEDRLTQDHVKVEAAFGDNAPSGMVVINACQTGRPGEGIAGVMGFADSFIRPMSQQGASVFAGALWSISDRLALTFVDTLYGELLNGKALVDAVRAAREACKQNEDFTWLAYSLYGHPFAKVVQ